MPKYQLKILDSLSALRNYTEQWNDLWLRCDIGFPTLRAEFLAQWIEQFASDETLRLMVVEHEGAAVAALPIVGKRMKGIVRVGGIPTNGWTSAGELLIDAEHELPSIARALATGIRALPWSFLHLQPLRYSAEGWQAVLAAIRAEGLSYETHPMFKIGTVCFPESWAAYEAGFSSKHRRNMRRELRRLHELAPTEFEDHLTLRPDEVAPLMQAGFEIEDRSWKGDGGTSVLRCDSVADFYIRQAEKMAAEGRLRLHFLVHAGERIAFQYGWLAKGTYYSPKIAYDPAFAKYSPGQLLTGHVLKNCCESTPRLGYDFHGDTTEAVARWTNGNYTIGSVAIPLRPLVGGALLQAYRWYNGGTAVSDQHSAVG